MRQIAEFLAVLACGLFTGQPFTSASLNHPAMNGMRCRNSLRLNFRRAIPEAVSMQAILAEVGLFFYRSVARRRERSGWVVAGLLLGSVIPFTLIVILRPTSNC